MLDKLTTIEERFTAIEDEMAANPEDYQRVAQLAQERAELEPVVSAFREYNELQDQLSEAESLRDGTDPEMQELAVQEIQEIQPKISEMDARLREMLIPRDPRDRRNVIMEIRAGTGGDEAGIFAADLYRMYSRYAEGLRWSVDLMSKSETGVGVSRKSCFRRAKALIPGSSSNLECTVSSVCL